MVLLVVFSLGLVCQCLAAAPRPYTSPSKEVGRALNNYDPEKDPRKAWEFGLGTYFQGDIMLRDSDFKSANGMPLTSTNRWPNGIIPYIINGTFSEDELANIDWAIEHYKNNTCIRFVPRTIEQIYVTIKNNGAGCWANMGRSTIPGKNNINLQMPECGSTGTIVHEMMHCAGFHHEFVRPDRDQWIYVNKSALLKPYQTDNFFNTNFGKYAIGLTYGIDYDYGSVMHYSKWGGAKSYKYPVMNNIKPWSGNFGNDTGFSANDILAINTMYDSKICST